MTGDVRPDADQQSLLEQLGFGAPSSPAPSAPASSTAPAAPARVSGPLSSELPPHARGPIDVPAVGSRREARELERAAASRAARTSGDSPERRIRAVQKSYAKPPRRRRGSAVVAAPPRGPRPAPARTRSTSRARTIGSRILSFAAMIFAGALAVGMSVPANAFGTGPSDQSLLSAVTGAAAPDLTQGQSVDVAATAKAASAARAAYTVTSWAEMLRLQYGTRDYNYTIGDPNAAIRWPFPYVVPISSGFGSRNAPCRGCSSNHKGLDFTPGEGAPIYAIAAGTVTTHDDDAYGFGNHVIISHGNLLGDGHDIDSLYAHMQHTSSPLKVGDKVEPGDFIGLVGMTGTATGPHLHFEIHVDGTPVDPFAWLKTNAG
jgi:murein DD-endopeptidase MepM/ murein hydrolase activator NlpD